MSPEALRQGLLLGCAQLTHTLAVHLSHALHSPALPPSLALSAGPGPPWAAPWSWDDGDQNELTVTPVALQE